MTAPDCAEVACQALVAVMRERGDDLHEHSDGVTQLAVGVGARIGLAGRELRELERAAQLHDLGKLVLAESLLSKTEPLSWEEWERVREHPVTGERMLRGVPGMARVARLVRASHERYDGNGYPDGLAGEEIPLAARVLSVCDSYDAMTSARPYSSPLTRAEAVEELQRCAGTQFDPGVVGVFCALLSQDATFEEVAA